MLKLVRLLAYATVIHLFNLQRMSTYHVIITDSNQLINLLGFMLYPNAQVEYICSSE